MYSSAAHPEENGVSPSIIHHHKIRPAARVAGGRSIGAIPFYFPSLYFSASFIFLFGQRWWRRIPPLPPPRRGSSRPKRPWPLGDAAGRRPLQAEPRHRPHRRMPDKCKGPSTQHVLDWHLPGPTSSVPPWRHGHLLRQEPALAAAPASVRWPGARRRHLPVSHPPRPPRLPCQPSRISSRRSMPTLPIPTVFLKI